MDLHEEDFREMTGRDLLLSLSRLGAVLVRDSLGLREEELNGDEDAPDSYDEEDDSMDEDGDAGDPLPSVSQGPPSCSFLFPGRTFAGHQRITAPNRQQEDWAGTATIYSCDFDRGRVTGRMTAQNNPSAKRPVITYFEGEIIDNVNNTFWTGCKWGTFISRETDMRYWTRCPGFTGALRSAVLRYDGRAPQLGSSQHVFMRWKECFFVDVPQDSTMTITGFYYLSLDRSTGSIGGYYHDTRSAPIQALQLRPLEVCGSGGSSGLGDTAGGGSSAGGRSSALGTDSGSTGVSSDATARAVQGLEIPEGMAFGSYSLC